MSPTTVMRSLTGLLAPKTGQICYDGVSFWALPAAERAQTMRRFGVMYQSGALWSSMTLSENVALPLEQYTTLSPEQVHALAAYKLALVGLRGFDDFYPSEISGGMQKRVGVARAMALDPEVLFFDEPSAGLDPLSARLLDELILTLRESLSTTMVVVTHELASIFTIADDAVFLDPETKTMLTTGNPRTLRDAVLCGISMPGILSLTPDTVQFHLKLLAEDQALGSTLRCVAGGLRERFVEAPRFPRASG